MTVIEAGGLVLIVAAGLGHGNDVVTRLPEMLPSPGDPTAWHRDGGYRTDRSIRIHRI